MFCSIILIFYLTTQSWSILSILFYYSIFPGTQVEPQNSSASILNSLQCLYSCMMHYCIIFLWLKSHLYVCVQDYECEPPSHNRAPNMLCPSMEGYEHELLAVNLKIRISVRLFAHLVHAFCNILWKLLFFCFKVENVQAIQQSVLKT